MATREREAAATRKAAQKASGPQATIRYLRMSPTKVRPLVDMIRGKQVEEALNLLTFNKRRAARHVAKLLKSAVANADDRGGFDLDRLFVDEVYVNEAPTWRRWMARAMGRANRVNKRNSHITVVLGEKGKN